MSASQAHFRIDMTNLTRSNHPNISAQPFTNITMDGEARNDSLEVSYIITIIFNIFTCPFTVLLNVSVIMAVKRRPRLQSYSNILLACLAVTDALTGLLVQPSFVSWKIFQLIGGTKDKIDIIRVLHVSLILTVLISSALHLMLVTLERLIAIKYTMCYTSFVTTRNVKVAVIVFWILALCCAVFKRIKATKQLSKLIVTTVLISCIVFMATSYSILYLETARHKRKIKTQQLRQEEVERFVIENKALRTTVYVVGAIVVCFLPMALAFLSLLAELDVEYSESWIRTFAMLNSLLNPLIYCWRQKEMRQFVFRLSSPAVAAVN